MTTPIVHLVSGILGSGKTTFCRHLLDVPQPEGQLGIVVGEYADEGYDDKPLRSTGAVVRQISSMQQKSQAPEYMREMHNLINMGCARIILETSGITSVGEVGKALKAEQEKGTLVLGRTAVVVDAGAFKTHESAFSEQLWATLDVADVIVINKTDKVADDEVYSVRNACLERNPEAKPVFAYMGQVQRSLVFGPPEDEDWTPRIMRIEDSDAPPPREFDAFVFRSNLICIDRVRFGHLLLNLPGRVARFKGVMKCWDKPYGVNGMPGQLDYDTAPVTGTTRMAFIGIGLDELEDEIKGLLKGELERQLADDDR